MIAGDYFLWLLVRVAVACAVFVGLCGLGFWIGNLSFMGD